MNCYKCTALTDGRLKFCGRCGASLYRHARWYEVLGQFLFWTFAPIALACLIFLFGFLFPPLLILVLLMFAAAPVMGLGAGLLTYFSAIRGPCPYCGISQFRLLATGRPVRGFSCPVCKHRMIARHGVFSRAG
jgi:hypothetical protein